jgi:hypothetical protein
MLSRAESALSPSAAYLVGETLPVMSTVNWLAAVFNTQRHTRTVQGDTVTRRRRLCSLRS